MKVVQRTLWKTQKQKNLEKIKRMTTYPEDDDKYMIAYICKKHGFIFWRNPERNTGMCLFCKQNDNTSSIQAHHIKDSEVTEEIREIVEQLSDERSEEYIRGDFVKVEESIKINDGKYTGKITDVTEKTEPYGYIHFVVDFTIGDANRTYDYSCASNILVDKETGKPTSKLAETLIEFGFKLDSGKEVTVDDLKKHFVGKSVESLLKNSVSKKGAKIIEVVTLTPQ